MRVTSASTGAIQGSDEENGTSPPPSTATSNQVATFGVVKQGLDIVTSVAQFVQSIASESLAPTKTTVASPDSQWATYDQEKAAYDQASKTFHDAEAKYNEYTTAHDAWPKAVADANATNAKVQQEADDFNAYTSALDTIRHCLIDNKSSIGFDETITLDELHAIADGATGFTPLLSELDKAALIAAAQWLLAHRTLLKQATGGMNDGDISKVDLTREFFAAPGLRDAIEGKKVAVPPEPQPPSGGRPTAPTPPTPPTCARPGSAKTEAKAEAQATPPTTAAKESKEPTGGSTATNSSDGASNWVGFMDKVQSRIDDTEATLNRRIELEGKKDLTDAEKDELKSLPSETVLTSRMQKEANRMKMLNDLYSTMSKLYSDMSMSIIRNIG